MIKLVFIILATLLLVGCGRNTTTAEKPGTFPMKPTYICIEGFLYISYPSGYATPVAPVFDKADRLPKRCDG